jgi:hypothetical protein
LSLVMFLAIGVSVAAFALSLWVIAAASTYVATSPAAKSGRMVKIVWLCINQCSLL